MTRDDIILKLEEIASQGGSIAELNACKALLALPEFASDDDAAADPFDALDKTDELAKKRRSQAA
jgi:hypothetical protein